MKRQDSVMEDSGEREQYSKTGIFGRIYRHSTTHEQKAFTLNHLHLTTADHQRICQNPASEFFLNKTTQIYARGLQKERYMVLSNNSDSRPSNFLFQIARGSGATLSECPFFKKAHVTQETSSRQTTSRSQAKKNPDIAISELFLTKRTRT